MRTLILILCLPLLAFAQESNIRAGGTFGGSSGAGFESPVYGVEVGGSLNLDTVVFDGTVRYVFAKKIPGGGHSVGGNVSTRLQFDRFFAGPAVAYQRQTTNAYTKSSFFVGGEAGKNLSPVIISGRFLQDVTSVNKTRSYDFRAEWYGKGRVGPYVSGLAGVRDFRCFQGPVGLTDHCFSQHASVSAGVFSKY